MHKYGHIHLHPTDIYLRNYCPLSNQSKPRVSGKVEEPHLLFSVVYSIVYSKHLKIYAFIAFHQFTQPCLSHFNRVTAGRKQALMTKDRIYNSQIQDTGYSLPGYHSLFQTISQRRYSNKIFETIMITICV